MLETINDSNSFLDEFEEENKPSTIIDGQEEKHELIESKTKPNTDDDEIKTITEIEGLEEEEDKEEHKEESQEEDSYSYKALLAHLKEQELVDFEDEENLEDTPELVYETIKKTVSQGINSYKESIPETGKKFLEFLEKGGDPSKYLETLHKPLDLSTLDLESESDQEKVMREYLKTQDYSSEEIDETISDYKDGLLLDKQSKVAAKKLEKAFEKRTENLLKEQEEFAEAQRVQYSNYITTISNTIDSVDTLAGLEVPKADKDKFRKYLLVKGKDGLTDYERELQDEPVKTQLELAFVKFKKYDFASAKKQGESQATQKMKWAMKTNESTVKGGKSADEISMESSLDAFRGFKKTQK